MTKELGLKKFRKRKYTWIYSKRHEKNQIGKRLTMMEYIESGFKKFTSIHDRLALEMNRYLQQAHVPEWSTKGRPTLIQKDPHKETVPKIYRPITCVPIMWKILTAQIRAEIYCLLTGRGLFPVEQKGCRKGSCGIAELIYIDQNILNESLTRRKNLAMAWIDYKKTMIWSHKAG